MHITTIISIIVSVISLIVSIINGIMNRKLKKKLSTDNFLKIIQTIMGSLFENLNNASVRMFPIIKPALSNNEKKVYASNTFNKATMDYNELLKLFNIHKCILPDEIQSLLKDFMSMMKKLIIDYQNELLNLIGETPELSLSITQYEDLIKQVENLKELFNNIENGLNNYIAKYTGIKTAATRNPRNQTP